MLKKISYEKQVEIAKLLLPYHGIFYKFWDMVRPAFEDDKKVCPTAFVAFNKQSMCVDFRINEEFWNSCCDHKKAFIVCHEILHVLLKHGQRGDFKEARMNPDITNMAMDIPINEMLVEYFGFDRNVVDKDGKFCWIDTCFNEDDGEILKDKNFEYYFNKFKTSKNFTTITVNNHGHLSSFDKDSDKIIDQISESVSEEEKKVFEEIEERSKNRSKSSGGDDPGAGLEAGTEAGNLKKAIKTVPPPPKKKWETVIKPWMFKVSRSFKEKAQWIVKPRRLSCMPKQKIFLPSSLEDEKRNRKKDKIQVWLFQDTSGSCVNLAERFFKAFESMPKDVFEVKMHCFDTRVFKMTERDVLTKTLYGFGGTTFSCINNFVISEMKKLNIEHPYVWVITDGYGDRFSTKEEKKWNFFLSTDNVACIPEKSKKYMLSDFE